MLGEFIGESRSAIDAVRQVVSRRDWHRLDAAVDFYGESFARLRHHLEALGVDKISDTELADLRQLDVMHRKVMRQLSWHMRHTEEDLETISRILH